MDPVLTPNIIWAIAGSVFTGGVAWGAARNKIAHLRRDHDDLKVEVVGHKKEDVIIHRQLLERTASVEAKVDLILQEVRRGG